MPITATPKSNKKQKLEQTDSGFDADLEKWAKKRQSTDLYMAYLHRGGPKNHGQKEYPKVCNSKIVNNSLLGILMTV